MMTREKAALGGGRKLAVLALPWVFLAVLTSFYGLVLLPQVHTLSIWIVLLGIFLGMTVLSFTVAAFTFSRDVLSGRYRR
jgi:uncharacterized membrane protein YdbT with pleckstrin-like domain